MVAVVLGLMTLGSSDDDSESTADAAPSTGPRSGEGFTPLEGRIVFAAPPSDTADAASPDAAADIFSVDADGSALENLTESPAGETMPAISPSGENLLFSRDDGLYLLHIGNGEVSQLASGLDQSRPHLAQYRNPSWAPDGSRIAFSSDQNRVDEFDIYVMNADGTDIHRLGDGFGQESGPSWSPDGSQIAFASTREGDVDLYVMNADGTGVRRLTRGPEIDLQPAWSPDGSTIAFTRISDEFDETGASKPSEVFLVNADGKRLRRLASGPIGAFSPTWSPDGSEVAFIESKFEPVMTEATVYAVAPDGSGRRRVFTMPGAIDLTW